MTIDTKAKRWDVYSFERTTRTATWLGTVEGPHQPGAHKAAAERWPDEARMRLPEYPSGRLILRPEGDTRGMPCTIVRK